MITKLKLMEYKIIKAKTSYGGLDTIVNISYYVQSTNRFHLLTFTLDSVQQEIIENSKDKINILHNFIIRKHETSHDYSYEQIKSLGVIDSNVLTQFVREHKLNELLK